MSDDYKTKILIEKSNQDKKANLFIKYIISLGLILLLSLVFITFKDHFLNYFSLRFNEKNSLKEEKKTTINSDTIENNTNISKKKTSLMGIDISEECKIYNLEDKLCDFKNLYQVVLKQLNENSKGIFSIESVYKIYSEQIKLFLEIKESSLQSFSNNIFEQAYVEIIEANKIFNLIKFSREEEFKNNMLSAEKAYMDRDENLAKEFIFTAEKYIPDEKKMLKLKKKIINISKIVKLENDIKSVSTLNDTELEINLIENIKQLDNLITKYDDRLKQLRLSKKNKEFNKLVAEVQNLLEDEKINIARKKLSLAEKIFPENNTIIVLRESINKKDKVIKINIIKKEIKSLIRDDKWQEIIKKYKDILILDNTNIFAVDGLKFAEEINELIKQINILNSTPFLLTKSENLDKATLLLESANNYIKASKKLLSISNLLEYNIKLANELAVVNIKSDNKTDIKVKKVGIIGKVKNKTIRLKAGRYIFEGKRRGYKTILIKKEIALDEKNVFLEIICNEPI
tara:strand:+ start:2683 stop:4227 length:1545 start_codon:yes stop_codon:yes gene_type:complete